ncbi:hypothetical protein [Xinfangfangia pollutisoli]|uniref:hypothetical protein n=1 Tax=Xinfangfangia pollutisoli TaxID=2865960 RepID=UPI001CD4C121|nr:hypothetical protein [Xinfangfangia pollutisoli]
MSDLRALIRELLSEEIASLRAEILGGAAVAAEPVQVSTEAQLTEFALTIARRAQAPGFLAGLEAGRIRFAPQGMAAMPGPAPVAAAVPAPAPAGAPVARLVTTVPAGIPELRKSLVTERDIAAIGTDQTRLRITKQARLTPLAGDEARRRGIRIERTLA